MTTLASTSLTDDEREVVERLLGDLREEFGDRLLAVWLYGSRARGEDPQEESDVDLLVLTRGGRADAGRVSDLAVDAMLDGPPGVLLSTQTYDPGWLARRREIEDFFIAEVDRDKVVLHGSA